VGATSAAVHRSGGQVTVRSADSAHGTNGTPALDQMNLPIVRLHSFATDATRRCTCDELIAQPASRSENVANQGLPPVDPLGAPRACVVGASEFIGAPLYDVRTSSVVRLTIGVCRSVPAAGTE
jgi:hypothetical protein